MTQLGLGEVKSEALELWLGRQLSGKVQRHLSQSPPFTKSTFCKVYLHKIQHLKVTLISLRPASNSAPMAAREDYFVETSHIFNEEYLHFIKYGDHLHIDDTSRSQRNLESQKRHCQKVCPTSSIIKEALFWA